MSNKQKMKKNFIQKLMIVFVILSIIGTIVWGAVYVINFAIGDENTQIDDDGNTVSTTFTKKKVINALICGKNQDLTDTIMYVKYNVDTGKIGIMSIPRDTSIVSNPTMSSALKINYLYYSKGTFALVNQVESMLGVNIDYYLVFDADMLKEMVDTIGGVEIDVPLRMKYDDGSQDLHIDLQPGVQVLNGKQAEGFVRFRHNNDMTVGYAMGDVQRTEVQQDFIKAFTKQVLSTKNISKIPELINIALKNTDTNITLREATKYITDASKIDIDNIYSCTAPGVLKDVGDKSSSWMSFFIFDKTEAQSIINNKFPSDTEEVLNQSEGVQ